MILAGLHCHPLKGARAIGLESGAVAPDGLEHDRRFMLVDAQGAGVTQRELQALAAVVATPVQGGVRLAFKGSSVTAGFDPSRRLAVTVWSSRVDAALAEDAVNAEVSAWFGLPLRLVHMDAVAERHEGGDWAGGAVPVGFADEYPLLVTTTGSLAALNRTLEGLGQPPVGMDRFRANLVIDHPIAWDEDFWATIEIGGLRIDLVKPCTRCIVTTQDQDTGARTGGNPIQGLSAARMSADRRVPGVLFGWNAVARGEAMLRLGDAVHVTARRTEGWPMKRRG